jgi:hypothetical protein
MRYAYCHPWLFSNEIPFVRLTFCLQQHKVSKKCRSLLKFLTAKKAYFKVATNVSLQLPLKWHPCHLPLKQAFFTETLNAGKVVAGPPNQLSAKLML